MSARDIIGAVLCAVGIAVGAVGYRLLGGMWVWFGLIPLAIGALLLAFSARAHVIERRLREYRGPGDWGQRGYLGGESAGSTFDSSSDSGGAGDGGGSSS